MKIIGKPAENALFLTSVERYTSLQFDFDPSSALFQREGNNLLLAFDNGGEAILYNFFMANERGMLPDITFPGGARINSADFLRSCQPDMNISTSLPTSETGDHLEVAGKFFSGAGVLGLQESLHLWNMFTDPSTMQAAAEFIEESRASRMPTEADDIIVSTALEEKNTSGVPAALPSAAHVLLITEADEHAGRYLFSFDSLKEEYDALAGQSNILGSFKKISVLPLNGNADEAETRLVFEITNPHWKTMLQRSFTVTVNGKKEQFILADGNSPIIYDDIEAVIHMADDDLIIAEGRYYSCTQQGEANIAQETGWETSTLGEWPLTPDTVNRVVANSTVVIDSKNKTVSWKPAASTKESLWELTQEVEEKENMHPFDVQTHDAGTANTYAEYEGFPLAGATGASLHLTGSTGVDNMRIHASQNDISFRSSKNRQSHYNSFTTTGNRQHSLPLDYLLENMNIEGTLDGGKIDFIDGPLKKADLHGLNALRVTGETGENGIIDCVNLHTMWNPAQTRVGYEGTDYHVYSDGKGALLLLQHGLSVIEKVTRGPV